MSIYAVVAQATVEITVKQILMSAIQTHVAMEELAWMVSIHSLACACRVMLDCTVRMTPRRVTTAGTSSRVTATSTSPRGGAGTWLNESVACRGLTSPASSATRSSSSSTALDRTTNGSASTIRCTRTTSAGQTAALCNMRTGGPTSQTASSRQERTA